MRRIMLLLVPLCLPAAVGLGAWTIDYPTANESFGTATNIEGHGDASIGGQSYTYRFRKNNSTLSMKTRNSIAGSPARWENNYVSSTVTWALEPPASGTPPVSAWPCGAAKVDVLVSSTVEVEQIIDITDSGC